MTSGTPPHSGRVYTVRGPPRPDPQQLRGPLYPTTPFLIVESPWTPSGVGGPRAVTRCRPSSAPAIGRSDFRLDQSGQTDVEPSTGADRRRSASAYLLDVAGSLGRFSFRTSSPCCFSFYAVSWASQMPSPLIGLDIQLRLPFDLARLRGPFYGECEHYID